MFDNPPPHLVAEEVRLALDAGLQPGFPQKVAANALGIVQRQLQLGPALAKAASDRLTSFAGPNESAVQDDASLAAAIRDGRIATDDPDLIAHLILSAVGKLAVDQPGYPAFQTWKAQRGKADYG